MLVISPFTMAWHNRHITESDANILMDAYEKSEKKLPSVSPQDFVNKIAIRIYTEFCEQAPFHTHATYQGEALREWIAKEAYHAIERMPEAERPGSDEEYQRIRTEVVRAIARLGIDLFTQWDGRSSPKMVKVDGKWICEDKRNLRQSVEPYMPPRAA